MFYNDFTNQKRAGLVAVELDQAAEVEEEHKFKFLQKQYDQNTRAEAAPRVAQFTIAELLAQKAGLLARVAEIDALIGNVKAMKVPLAKPIPVKPAIIG